MRENFFSFSFYYRESRDLPPLCKRESVGVLGTRVLKLSLVFSLPFFLFLSLFGFMLVFSAAALCVCFGAREGPPLRGALRNPFSCPGSPGNELGQSVVPVLAPPGRNSPPFTPPSYTPIPNKPVFYRELCIGAGPFCAVPRRAPRRNTKENAKQYNNIII